MNYPDFQRDTITEQWLHEHGFVMEDKQWRLAGFVLKRISLVEFAVFFRTIFLKNVEFTHDLEQFYLEHIGSPVERL